MSVHHQLLLTCSAIQLINPADTLTSPRASGAWQARERYCTTPTVPQPLSPELWSNDLEGNWSCDKCLTGSHLSSQTTDKSMWQLLAKKESCCRKARGIRLKQIYFRIQFGVNFFFFSLVLFIFSGKHHRWWRSQDNNYCMDFKEWSW